MVWKQGASPVYDQSNNAGRQREIRRREVVSMSVRRIMGTETEYAVSALGMEHYNPVKLSFDVVGAAANERTITMFHSIIFKHLLLMNYTVTLSSIIIITRQSFIQSSNAIAFILFFFSC